MTDTPIYDALLAEHAEDEGVPAVSEPAPADPDPAGDDG